jgi:hypothetical protein
MQGWLVAEYHVHGSRGNSAVYIYVYDQWREQSDSHDDGREQHNSISTDRNGRDLYVYTGKCAGCKYDYLQSVAERKCNSNGKSVADSHNKRNDGCMP